MLITILRTSAGSEVRGLIFFCCLSDWQVSVRRGRLEDRSEVDGQGQVEERDHHVAGRLRHRRQV